VNIACSVKVTPKQITTPWFIFHGNQTNVQFDGSYDPPGQFIYLLLFSNGRRNFSILGNLFGVLAS
jgi:hypothetical protein